MSLKIPFYSNTISAGFPSPADDDLEGMLDLNKHLIKHPSSTFLFRAKDLSMIKVGIFTDDILIVDRSINPSNGKIVVVCIDGEVKVKRLFEKRKKTYLISESNNINQINVTEDPNVIFYGVVTTVIHSL